MTEFYIGLENSPGTHWISMNPGAVLIGIPLLHFRKMSVWPFDGIYCGAPVLHMRGLQGNIE